MLFVGLAEWISAIDPQATGPNLVGGLALELFLIGGAIQRSEKDEASEEIRAFRNSWDNACASAGHPMMIPHDFRRTAVRNLVRAECPRRRP